MLCQSRMKYVEMGGAIENVIKLTRQMKTRTDTIVFIANKTNFRLLPIYTQVKKNGKIHELRI